MLKWKKGCVLKGVIVKRERFPPFIVNKRKEKRVFEGVIVKRELERVLKGFILKRENRYLR